MPQVAAAAMQLDLGLPNYDGNFLIGVKHLCRCRHMYSAFCGRTGFQSSKCEFGGTAHLSELMIVLGFSQLNFAGPALHSDL